MPFDALVQVEPVTFIRPERIDPGGYERDMLLPVALDMRCIDRLTGFGWNGAVQCGQYIAIPGHHVHDDFDVLRVHLVEYNFRIALEYVRMELEGWLSGVPAFRAEAGAEVNHRIDWYALGTEGVDDA